MRSRYSDHTLRFFESLIRALEPRADYGGMEQESARFSAWEELGDLLVLSRLAPYCAHRAEETGIIGVFPDGFRVRLERALAGNSIRSLLWKRELEGLFSLLGRENIPLLIAKGAASFFRNHYRHSAVRVMNDCDVWLPPDAPPDILDPVLRERGYRRMDTRSHHTVYRHRETRLSLEVHSRLTGAFLDSGERARLERTMWDRSLPLAAEGFPSVSILSPRDTLFFHVYHSSVEHFSWVYESCADFVEFARLMEFHGDGRIWGDVMADAREYGLAPFFDTFTGITGLILGHRIPAGNDRSSVPPRVLRRFLDGERTAPWFHPWRKRLLILREFPGSWRDRANRLRHIVRGDTETVREQRRPGQSRR